MPKRYSVLWTRIACRDLDAILEFIERDTPDRADRLLDEILDTARGLSLFPQRGKVVPELREHGLLVYRELSCPPWKIYYRIEGNRVAIFGVFDGRRNLEDILLERFLH